jgi:glycosyltransferase involved in cell wall biosynthesis
MMQFPLPSHLRRRVLQVITPSRMSGAEMQLVRMSRHLSARGHELATIVKRNSPAIAEMRRLGLHVDALPIQGKASFWAPAIIAHQARKHRAELVQSTLSTASWWCGWLEWIGGPPSIGHVQGFTSALWHRHQSHLLVVSNAVKEDLIDQGIDSAKMTVLHNALAPEDFYPTHDPLVVRAEFGAGASTPVVGTFAHLSLKKGHRELISAASLVVRQLPHAQFWIVGQGRRLEELESQARSLGVGRNVRFLGFRRDVADLMNAIDVMALPSHREPCALVYIEAALSRKPIIACRAGGAPESISDGETGILTPVGDSEAIANALLEMLTNRRRATQMGEAGYHRALALFGWNRYVRILESVYQRVLDERSGSSPSRHRAAA